jgi:phage shock protein A
MFKTLIILMRGRAYEAGQRLSDQNALAILDQPMRDAGAAVERMKKALAVALAQDRREESRADALRRQAGDTEERAVAALKGGREDLARKAAEAIVALETDLAASLEARDLFGAEIAKLERRVRDRGRRLADLERGRRMARAAQAVRNARRGRVEAAPLCQSTPREAEEPLSACALSRLKASRRRRRATPSTASLPQKPLPKLWPPKALARPGRLASAMCSRA